MTPQAELPQGGRLAADQQRGYSYLLMSRRHSATAHLSDREVGALTTIPGLMVQDATTKHPPSAGRRRRASAEGSLGLRAGSLCFGTAESSSHESKPTKLKPTESPPAPTGHAFGFGWNGHGQLGCGDLEPSVVPQSMRRGLFERMRSWPSVARRRSAPRRRRELEQSSSHSSRPRPPLLPRLRSCGRHHSRRYAQGLQASRLSLRRARRRARRPASTCQLARARRRASSLPSVASRPSACHHRHSRSRRRWCSRRRRHSSRVSTLLLMKSPRS